MNELKTFEDLECWKKCRDLRVFVFEKIIPSFCSNARGSAYEVLDHLITAFDESLIDESLYNDGRRAVEESIKLLNGYIHYLQDKSKA